MRLGTDQNAQSEDHVGSAEEQTNNFLNTADAAVEGQSLGLQSDEMSEEKKAEVDRLKKEMADSKEA